MDIVSEMLNNVLEYPLKKTFLEKEKGIKGSRQRKPINSSVGIRENDWLQKLFLGHKGQLAPCKLMGGPW